MALHIRLIQTEMYLPNVSSTSELHKALGHLRRYCKEQQNVALSIESYGEADRGQFSLLIVGSDKSNVEQESERLLTWIESHIEGQGLTTEVTWL